MYKITSNNPQDTRGLAQKIALNLKGGEILFLYGPIGAGKTVFVKALAKALGLKGSPVSASFSLMKEYKGKGKKMYHADLFRLEENEMFNLGFEAMLEDENAIIVVEWPGPMEKLIKSSVIKADFILKEGDAREIIFTASGAKAENFLKTVFG
ncbi:Conserved hypothetical nucleotide-binding protein [Elusimicrobium minutum Pei191]|uniref:tRNA threonylcarbamoyladenosine biosynthesis protein TsaE n=1 Tax=Elusimicrobium minutum (strain Pei191) TaxID=445932 RepID=B2KDW3_ELUMP|nr:tRNA (adenosine(37)-N6)-threonylcarbamoyltransferase complex ATPase subunit type 1 TsaE [Elusimicrobium minutum]ACC98709.1 Conserved hypothetical nucleotide-binding protein [Elusimicrobium minutum Pei191]